MALLYILILIILVGIGFYFVFLGLGFPFYPVNWIGEKRLILPALALAALALEIGFLWLVYTKAPTPQDAIAETIHDVTAYSAAAAMRSRMTFPIPTGRGMDLINLTSNKGNIVREYRVEATNDEDFQTLMEYAKDWLDKTICQDQANVPIFKAQLGLELWFHQSDQPYVEKYTYTPAQCRY